jgi:hypothetical protein
VFSIDRLYVPQLDIEKLTRDVPETRHLVEDGQSEVRTKLSWEIQLRPKIPKGGFQN